MKKIKLFTLLVLFSVFTSGYTKHVAVKYNDFNLLFSGSVVSEKNETPTLTLKSLSSGVVCSGKPQITEVMFFNYINPVYNGVFGKSYLSCNDGSKLFINWKVKKMIVDKANGSGEDAYGHKLSFYIDKNATNVSKKLEQYKKDIAQKPILANYRTNILQETPPVLNSQAASQNETPVSVQKIEKELVKEIPAVAKKEEKKEPRNISSKKVQKIAPKATTTIQKTIEKSKPKEENSAAVKKEEKVTTKQAPKIVETENKVVPVKCEKKVLPVQTETKINKEENDKILEIKQTQQETKANVQAQNKPKEVVTTFHGDKQADVSDLKKFKSAVDVDSEKDKLKKINDSSPLSTESNVFSMKNLLLKFTFGYNVANPAQKF